MTLVKHGLKLFLKIYWTLIQVLFKKSYFVNKKLDFGTFLVEKGTFVLYNNDGLNFRRTYYGGFLQKYVRIAQRFHFLQDL